MYPKNIILKTYTEPILIDFEKSEFRGLMDRFWRDIDDFIGEIARNVPYGNRFDSISRECIMNIAYKREPTIELINEILETLKGI